MIHDDLKELLKISKENNKLLRKIISYLNIHTSNANNENMEDFIRNIVANMVSNKRLF